MIFYTASEYQTFLRQQLARISPYIITELQNILAIYAEEKSLELEFDIHSDRLDGHLPVQATLLRDGEVIKTWDLAKQIRRVLAPEQMEELVRFDKAGVEISEVTLQTLIEWFANCWDLANGPGSGLPCQISIHDDIEAFDLNRHEWIQKKIPPKTNNHQSIAFL
jgi:hypothetical protein